MAAKKETDSKSDQKPKTQKAKPEAGSTQSKRSKGQNQVAAGQLSVGKPKISPSKEPRLKQLFDEKILAQLQQELGLNNSMEVPRLEKIVVSTCLKEALLNPKVLDASVEELSLMTGQRPVVTKAKKAIAAFKLRKGIAIGAMVTLRRARMYEFLDRLINVALPRVRDFKGISPKAFDGRGNYSLGIREQIIFPEINYERVDKVRGLNVTIVTSAKNNDHARALLTGLGMPFRKN